MSKLGASILATLALLGASWLAGVATEAADMTRPAGHALAIGSDTYNEGDKQP